MKYRYLKRAAYISIIIISAIAILGIAIEASQKIAAHIAHFPWWYNAILGRHMPQWLIRILENPWLIATTAALLFIAKIIIFSYLTAKLVKERNKNKKLSEEYRALEKVNRELQSENEHHKAINAQLVAILTSLATQHQQEKPNHTPILQSQSHTTPTLPL